MCVATELLCREKKRERLCENEELRNQNRKDSFFFQKIGDIDTVCIQHVSRAQTKHCFFSCLIKFIWFNIKFSAISLTAMELSSHESVLSSTILN